MTQIQNALLSLFAKHRVVFWYDTKKEFRLEYDELYLPAVEKMEINNNQFGLKHQILREHPAQKYLLYFEGPQPRDIDNWLLDVQLAETVFSADQSAIWLTELGLDPGFLSLIASHHEFFTSDIRLSKLKSLISATDTKPAIMTKMLAILVQCDPLFDEIVACLLSEFANGKNAFIELIKICGLDEFLWKEANCKFGYSSEEKGIDDFALKLFDAGYLVGVGEKPRLTNDAYVFLKRWKDNVNSQNEFDKLSEKYADILNIEENLKNRDYRSLLEADIFRKIEVKIIRELAKGIKEKTILPAACREIIHKRRTSHWFPKYEQFYAVIENASLFLEVIQEVNLAIDNFQDGVRKYSSTWFKLDQYYRKVFYHARRAGNLPILEDLLTLIENQYTNKYLSMVNNLWQEQVDRIDGWDAAPIPMQSAFYDRYVKPFLDDGKKVYVVVSDALRYEIGEELNSAINREDRYEAQIETNVSMLPSYTQLGMAALLPHENLVIANDSSGTVFVDQVNSSGTENRNKILKKYRADATAIRAEDFLGLSAEDTRDLVRENSVVYVYHNHIDATGDKKDTEERVFEAAEETSKELILIIKKLNAGNATNMVITADHGFLYQNSAIDESDFSTIQPQGKEILYQTRRFVIGKGLEPAISLRSFTTENLGLLGDLEVQIPKSINRLRLSGSGSRYVHGGASLQEIVIPVIRINKKRESDISKVEIAVIQSTSKVITTSQFSVTLYQVEPVNDKRQSRQIRVAIFDQKDHCISDKHEILFDSVSENSRDREHRVRFLLTRDADKVDNQDVFLKLEEKIPNTEHYREYQKIVYTVRRTFTADFDF